MNDVINQIAEMNNKMLKFSSYILNYDRQDRVFFQLINRYQDSARYCFTSSSISLVLKGFASVG
jgi:hypothetical protein